MNGDIFIQIWFANSACILKYHVVESFFDIIGHIAIYVVNNYLFQFFIAIKRFLVVHLFLAFFRILLLSKCQYSEILEFP